MLKYPVGRVGVEDALDPSPHRLEKGDGHQLVAAGDVEHHLGLGKSLPDLIEPGRGKAHDGTQAAAGETGLDLYQKPLPLSSACNRAV